MRALTIVAAAMLAGCLDGPFGVPTTPAPTIDAATVAPSQTNVLSAIVTARARGADSVAVRLSLASRPQEYDVTPAVPADSQAIAMPVLGLMPEQSYHLRVVAYGAGGTAIGDPIDFATGPLPPDLPRYTAAGVDPSPGYVVFAAGMYGLVIDNTGRVVWYYRFPSGPGLAFMAQATGRFVARPPTPQPGDLEPWVAIDPLGNVTRTMGCARGLQPRLHDLMSQPDGSYWIMCDETRTMDLSGEGGVAAARVTGTVVQHIAADGALLFDWNPFDHFAITDVAPSERIGVNVNWMHGNAIDLDADGNLLASFRNLEEVTKIDTRTGAVIWRLGGRRNQFEFLGTPMPAFVHQHGVRRFGSGGLVILDNIGDPAESRAERYILDEVARTARLAQSYGSVPRVVTQIGGSVQPLTNGRTLVSFGTEGRVEEYDAEGRVMWSIQGNAGYVFRAQRIRSLYAPGVGTPR